MLYLIIFSAALIIASSIEKSHQTSEEANVNTGPFWKLVFILGGLAAAGVIAFILVGLSVESHDRAEWRVQHAAQVAQNQIDSEKFEKDLEERRKKLAGRDNATVENYTPLRFRADAQGGKIREIAGERIIVLRDFYQKGDFGIKLPTYYVETADGARGYITDAYRSHVSLDDGILCDAKGCRHLMMQ